MDGRRRPRLGKARALAALTVALITASAGRALATFRYGDIQVSGNLQTQNLFRIQDGSATFDAFNPVQQRNTFRLQYEHQLIKQGKLLNTLDLSALFKRADLFLYYRGVYDSIYEIAPGPFLRCQDGSRCGKIGDFAGRRTDMALEDVLREAFIDLDVAKAPISFRIGRQQIVWGEAISFRALDSVNALDITWHAQQEAGLFGKVGFDELRIPSWAAKMIYNFNELGPLSSAFFEIYDIPFEFNPAKVRFDPAPWSVAARNPFRGGLIVPLGGGQSVQACFDTTGSSEPNQIVNPTNIDLSDTAQTGFCNTKGLQRSSLRQGIYDGHDPMDVNQWGARFGAITPMGINFTLNYLYRRNLGADIPGATVAKAQVGAVNGNLIERDPVTGLPTGRGFIIADPHSTTDPITRETSQTAGYARVPVEFYYPYVHVAGFSANYAEEYTGSVINVESAWTHGLPIATLNPFGNGLRKSDTVLSAIGFDRPTWIRWLNPRSTWTIITQADINWITDHHPVKFGTSPFLATQGQRIPIDGDVGLPNSTLIPGQFGGGDLATHIDRLEAVESVFILAASSFYRGGTFVPTVAVITDLVNFPSQEFSVSFDYLPTNNIILTPALRIFTNYGRNVDEPWGVGRFSQNDEVQIKATYQF